MKKVSIFLALILIVLFIFVFKVNSKASEPDTYTITYTTDQGYFEPAEGDKKTNKLYLSCGSSIGESHIDITPYSYDYNTDYYFVGYNLKGTDVFYYYPSFLSVSERKKTDFYNHIPTSDESYESVWKKSINISFVTDETNGYYSVSSPSGELREYTKSQSIPSGYSIDSWCKGIKGSDLTPKSLKKFDSSEDTYVFIGFTQNNDSVIYSVDDILSMTFEEDTTFYAQWELNDDPSSVTEEIQITYFTDYGQYEHSSLDGGKKVIGTMQKGLSMGQSHINYMPYSNDDDYLFVGYLSQKSRVFYSFRQNMPVVVEDNSPFCKYIPESNESFNAVWKKKINIEFSTDLSKGYYLISTSPGTIKKVSKISKSIAEGETFRDWYPTTNNSDIEPDKENDEYSFIGWKRQNDDKIYSNTDVLDLKIQDDTVFVAQWKNNTPSNNSSGGKQNNSKKTNNNKKSNTSTPKKTTSKYSDEWVNGKWYDKNGKQTYSGKLSWKCNSKGWWVEDSAGWYPQNQWQKIDGIWYFFKPDGYMASSEYYNGYWFNKDGSWDSQYYLTWKSNSKGWWVEDKSGWWPSSKWLKIDGDWYYFKGDGYMASNTRIDGYWIGANGVCQ